MTGSDRPAGLHFQCYVAATRGPVRWRLLGGNNRDLGRSALEYDDVELALIGLKEVVRELDSLRTRIVPAAGNRWSWQLLMDNEPVVVSAHAFDRRIRCQMAAGRFVAAAAVAEVSTAPPTRPRRR
jgi:hypothetical protein